MALSKDPRTIEWVTEDIIRGIFNESQLYDSPFDNKLMTMADLAGC
jgi:hypothetical protein